MQGRMSFGASLSCREKRNYTALRTPTKWQGKRSPGGAPISRSMVAIKRENETVVQWGERGNAYSFIK